MRVLQILPELDVGGVETGTVDFAKYLKEHGHHAVVISNGGSLVVQLQKHGVPHYKLPVHKKSFFSFRSLVKNVREIIMKEKIDIVHARSRVPAWIAYFACRRTRARFITTCHGYYSKHFFSRVMGWAKLVIVPSEVIGRHMIENFNVPGESIRTIPRSVDLKKFNLKYDHSTQKSKYTVTIVGRITPIKGHTYFLKAMSKVIRSMPYVKVWIVGDVPAKKKNYKKDLEVLIRRLGLVDHVEFLGKRQDIPELLSQSDVLVMSSTVPEAFGRVIVEAQAIGVPVVATRIGGAVEIIEDNVTGLLVLPKDTDGMAAAVLRYLNDRKLARDVSVAARKRIDEKFTLEHMAERTITVYKELMNSCNILIVKLSSVGDVILTTAAIRAIRKKFSKAKLHCLVGQESRQILQRCPYIDELIVIDEKHKGFKHLLNLSKKLRHYKFDMVIDLQNNRFSHALCALTFAQDSYGYSKNKFGFLLTHLVPNPVEKIPPVEHQFQILKMLGIEHKENDYLELWLGDRDRKEAAKLLEEEWLHENASIVGIHLGASKRWETKNWPADYIARLCDIVAGQNLRVVLTGVEKDRQTAREISAMTKTKPAILIGKTDLMVLAAVIKKCKVFISPDSAPMHLAAAVRTPFIALFGPTDSQRHAPPAKHYTIIEKKIDCSPCYSTKCRILTHQCMKDITPEEVAMQVNRLIVQT